MGFIWAFKIWILETFPICCQWWKPYKDKFPRGIRRSYDVTVSKSEKYLFNVPFATGMIPLKTLELLPEETKADWWIASKDCFAVVKEDVDPVDPANLRQPSPHVQRDDDASVVKPPPPPSNYQRDDSSLEERFMELHRQNKLLNITYIKEIMRENCAPNTT